MTRKPLKRRHLAALAFVPALLSGCSAIPAFSSDDLDRTASEASMSSSGPSWIVATQGSARPSATPSYRSAAPTASPTSGFLPLGPAPTVTRTPVSTCSPNTFKFSRIDGLGVTPGSRSAVLSWYNVGGYNLVEFRLYAISQNLTAGAQRDVRYVTVKPSAVCGQMTGTIGNLEPKTEYVFSVDAVVTRRSGDGTYAATVARSHTVATA